MYSIVFVVLCFEKLCSNPCSSRIRFLKKAKVVLSIPFNRQVTDGQLLKAIQLVVKLGFGPRCVCWKVEITNAYRGQVGQTDESRALVIKQSS